VGLFYAQFRPLGFDDWDSPPPYRASLSLDWVLSATGTGRLGLEAKFPKISPGWRFELRLWLRREARQNYFGIGNNTDYDRDDVTDLRLHYYKQDRHRLYARGALQREIVSGLRALAGFHLERWRIDTLAGSTMYAEEVASGIAPSPDQSTVEANIRLGLVYDTRDDEVDPTNGLHVEAIYSHADSSVAGDVTYDRMTVSAAAYFPVTERVVLAARVVGQGMGGDPPLGTYYLIETSESPFEALGGPKSHRGLASDRFLGEDKLFGNLDVRYRIAGERHVASASLVGFVDVGRVFQPGEDDFELTLNGMHVGAGFGAVLTFGRSGVLGWTLGYGPDRLALQTHVGWMF
jgi:outer membrane protein assembly factor BamA